MLKTINQNLIRNDQILISELLINALKDLPYGSVTVQFLLDEIKQIESDQSGWSLSAFHENIKDEKLKTLGQNCWEKTLKIAAMANYPAEINWKNVFIFYLIHEVANFVYSKDRIFQALLFEFLVNALSPTSLQAFPLQTVGFYSDCQRLACRAFGKKEINDQIRKKYWKESFNEEMPDEINTNYIKKRDILDFHIKIHDEQYNNTPHILKLLFSENKQWNFVNINCNTFIRNLIDLPWPEMQNTSAISLLFKDKVEAENKESLSISI